LIDLSPDMAKHLSPGGYAILSGILVRQAQEVIDVYAQNGINLVRNDNIGEWVTLTLRKNA
jgi:ribosomal protein L11 methyltransferase